MAHVEQELLTLPKYLWNTNIRQSMLKLPTHSGFHDLFFYYTYDIFCVMKVKKKFEDTKGVRARLLTKRKRDVMLEYKFYNREPYIFVKYYFYQNKMSDVIIMN
jgi:hypothetical protein